MTKNKFWGSCWCHNYDVITYSGIYFTI